MKNIKRRTKLAAAGLTAIVATFALTGAACASDADRTSENIAIAAEAFEVQRTIVGINGISGETIFFAEGRCSFEYPSDSRFDVTCKYSPDEYRKHTFVLGDQDSVVVSQEQSIDVSEYHTRIILKPQNIIPEFDIMVGEDR